MVVQCSCGALPHLVLYRHLAVGNSTRCNVCAKRQAGYWRKTFYGYSDIVPDEAHRVRLLNRISACIGRCERPTDTAYRHYGGRGIRVWPEWVKDRRAFLRYLVALDGWDQPELELDRIDVDKGYQPGNLRFCTRVVNMLNKRSVERMQNRILELEARLRSCKCGATAPLHDPDF